MNKTILFLGIGVILLGNGCLARTTKTALERQIASETGGAVDIDIQEGAVTYENQETGGTVSVGADINLPSDFPSDFPVYTGDITLIGASNTPNQETALIFSSKDIVSDIAGWYEKELTSRGWTRDQEYSLQETLMRSYQKEGLRMTVSLSQSEGIVTGTIVQTNE